MPKPTIEEIAYTPPDPTFPSAVQEAYEGGLKTVGQKIWHTIQKLTPGILIGIAVAAAIVLIGGAANFGHGAALGQITSGGGSVVATPETGIALGLQNGLSFLTGAPGLAFLATGALIGGGIDYMRKSGQEKTVMEAQEKKKELDKARGQAQERSRQPAVDRELNEPDPGLESAPAQAAQGQRRSAGAENQWGR